MRTALITGTNLKGETKILFGESPFSEARKKLAELNDKPPTGFVGGTLWISDAPAKDFQWADKPETK